MLRYFLLKLYLPACLLANGQMITTEIEYLDLPSNHVYNIVQDGLGNLWFGTNRGIVNFNGGESKLFTIKNGLPFNDIFHLKNDPADPNMIWYFGSGKYCGYILNDSVYKISSPNEEIINPDVHYVTANGLLMQSIHELYRIDRDGFHKIISEKETMQYRAELTHANHYEKTLLQTAFIPRKNRIDLMSISLDTIYLLNTYTNRTQCFPIPKGAKKLDESFQDGGLIKEEVYMVFSSNGACFFELTSLQLYYLPFPEPINPAHKKYISCKTTKSGFQLNIPEYHLILNDSFQCTQQYYFPNTDGTYQYFQDAAGNVWIPDFANGVSLYSKIRQNTPTYLTDKKVKNLSVFNREIFAYVSDVGYYRLASEDSTFRQVKNMPSSFQSYGETQIAEDTLLLISSGNCYTLTPDGITRFKLKNKPGGFVKGLKDVCYTEDQAYAIVTGAIWCFDPDTMVEKYSIKAAGATDLTWYNESLYAAGTFGLRVLKDDSLHTLKTKNELLDVTVLCICNFGNYLAVGTEGRGVYLFANDEVIHLSNTEDLIVRRIIPDENMLWLATDKGILQIDLTRQSLRNAPIVNAFYRADGLIQDNVNDICFVDNYLYASCDKGISRIKIDNPLYSKPVSLMFNTQNDTLVYFFGNQDQITVPFSIIGFDYQDHYSISFRLDNATIWTPTTERKLLFHNLSPGLYKLDVKAVDQHLNTSVKSVYIKIYPLWWQTLWARVVFLVGGILLLLVINQIVQNRIQKTIHTKIERSKGIYRLELQALRAQMNPHFIHNSLNSIQYYIQRNEVELSESYLEKFSNLIRLFFDYAHLQHITIAEEINLLKNYLEIEHLRFEDKLEYEISVDDQIDIEEQVLPTMILQPLVENAINHGIFHKSGSGKVSIRFACHSPSAFSVIVEDNGIGWIKAKELQTAKGKKYNHNSSSVLHERLKLFENSGLWKITYEITDLSVNENQTGTRINLRIDENQNNNTTR